MITFGGVTISAQDPSFWVIGSAVFIVFILTVVFFRPRRSQAPLARHLAELDGAVRALNDGQNQLHGGITHIAEAQAISQARLAESLERRLGDVSDTLGKHLGTNSRRTARSLGDLQQRLEAIDRAQGRIEKLSGDVLGLQDILSNKQTRGAFGEIQLREIVGKALPPDAAGWQVPLSNGTRVDCLIHMPVPPGPVAIDAKFPLEPYEALIAAESKPEVLEAKRKMRAAVRGHMRAIAEKYIIEGETAEGALMFLPSEAVYAELHGQFPDLVREGFELRVWIVSPTTCMATLHTLRAVLKDTRLREEAHAIRRELSLLYKDVERLSGRVENLQRHFGQAQKDVEEIRISADRAQTRSRRLEVVDFSDGQQATAAE